MRPAFIGGLVSAEPIKGDWAALDDPVPHLGLVIVVGRQRVVEMPHVLVVEDEGVDGVGGPGQREVLSAFGGFLRQLTAPRAGVGKPGDPRCEIGGNRRRNQCEKGGQAVSEHSRAEPQPNAGDAARRKAPCESRKAEDGELYISKVFVDEGVTMKRMRPAPQGRGYRIRKRSNHVTLFVDAKTNDEK